MIKSLMTAVLILVVISGMAQEKQTNAEKLGYEKDAILLIGQMKPGLNQLIVHLAHDNEEMKAIALDHPDFGAAWRQRNLEFVSCEAFRNVMMSR